MALLAESLVEEWLNRNNFFTIRGVKHGVNEIDLLAVRHEQGRVIGWHVEVQVSFRPVGYICKLTDEMAVQTGRKKTSAKQRSEQEIRLCVAEWVRAKFNSNAKQKVREQLWPGLDWQFRLVHAEVKDKAELEMMSEMNINLIPFHKILYTLCLGGQSNFSGSAGGDLAEVVHYFGQWRSAEAYRPNDSKDLPAD